VEKEPVALEDMMAGERVDARGLVCPKPLIMTKKALGNLAVGQEMEILIDNETSRDNVVRFLKDNGATVDVSTDGGVHRLAVTKSQDSLPHPEAADYCSTSVSRPHVVCFRSDRMGVGDEDLGSILIQAFVNTIHEVTPLPSHVILYNRGVYLAAEGSALTGPLTELGESGVETVVCGTCVDYYGLRDKIRVGTISNMYEIMQTLTSAGHILSP
jgi:selenium metabolism protein YedF